jgi:hypothetical protein
MMARRGSDTCSLLLHEHRRALRQKRFTKLWPRLTAAGQGWPPLATTNYCTAGPTRRRLFDAARPHYERELLA